MLNKYSFHEIIVINVYLHFFSFLRHEELITQGGEYAQMWEQQLRNDAAGERRGSVGSNEVET